MSSEGISSSGTTILCDFETIERYRVLHVGFIEGDNGSHEPSLPVSIGIDCLHVYSSFKKVKKSPILSVELCSKNLMDSLGRRNEVQLSERTDALKNGLPGAVIYCWLFRFANVSHFGHKWGMVFALCPWYGYVSKKKSLFHHYRKKISTSPFQTLVFTSDGVRVRVIVGVIRELMT